MKNLLTSTLFLLPFYVLFGQIQVLHYVETTGFDHNTREVSVNFFQDLGKRFNFTVVQDSDGSQFDTAENLSQFSLVIFSNTTGDQGLSQNQRQNLETYINQGGSYLGIHSASDTYRHSSSNGGNKGSWDWYAETLAGCSVQQGPNHTSQNYNANIRLIPSNTALDDNIPNPWNKNEEWYYWENGYLSPAFTTLLEVERTGNNSYDAARMVAHFRELPGGGKAFYTSLGHSGQNFTDDKTFRQLMSNALSWVLGAESRSAAEILREEMNPRFVNPASGELTLVAEVPRAMDLHLEVYDLKGSLLNSFAISYAEAGQLNWKNELDLSAGWYLGLLIIEGETIFTDKFYFDQ